MQAAGRVQRDDLEQCRGRDADGGGLRPRDQLTRLPADAPRVSFNRPDPRVRVEQQHGSTAVDIPLVVNRIEGPLVLEDRALHRAEEPLLPLNPGTWP